MSTTKHEDYKKRRDPYDPRTGATANDDPNGSETDVNADPEAGSPKKHGDSLEPLDERARRRSSPGSGEDKRGAADIQPDDVEQDEPAR